MNAVWTDVVDVVVDDGAEVVVDVVVVGSLATDVLDTAVSGGTGVVVSAPASVAVPAVAGGAPDDRDEGSNAGRWAMSMRSRAGEPSRRSLVGDVAPPPAGGPWGWAPAAGGSGRCRGRAPRDASRRAGDATEVTQIRTASATRAPASTVSPNHATAAAMRRRTSRLCPSRIPGNTGTGDRAASGARPLTTTSGAFIALVEDDAHIRRAVAESLERRGHVVQAFGDPVVALAEMTANPPDIVVLDLGLPRLDGAEVLRMLRSVHDVPVIVASARDDDGGIVETLDSGADDYLVKPFSAEQLDARVRAVLRRTRGGRRDGPLVVGGLVIDPASHDATLDGRPLDLTRKEFQILVYLAERAGDVVGKRELARDVWHLPAGGSDKTIDVHLSWIRRKLGETPSTPRYLHTVRGVGVRLVDPGDARRSGGDRRL